MSKDARCMRCGREVSGLDSVYVIAHSRKPSRAPKGFSSSKLASATLCHDCGKDYRTAMLRWMEVGR